jgi:pimeloyl-ACP methyl ester carboxylesterase
MARRVVVGSLEVEYDEVGEGERPFVLVHGFSGSRDDFADVLDPLGALGRTLVPDLRGHGGTTNARRLCRN